MRCLSFNCFRNAFYNDRNYSSNYTQSKQRLVVETFHFNRKEEVCSVFIIFGHSNCYFNMTKVILLNECYF